MNGQLLNSWKEIANYLGRGVRTVQRWERDLALPVRRPRGYGRSAVLALTQDLDEWLRRSAVLVARSEEHDGRDTQIGTSRRKLRVVVVDDDEAQLYIANKVIEALGHEALPAHSAECALRFAGTGADLMLLDVNLPHIHGFEVLRRIKANPLTRDLRVVMLSSTYEPWGAAATAVHLGASAFLSKPITVETVRPVIEKLRRDGIHAVHTKAS